MHMDFFTSDVTSERFSSRVAACLLRPSPSCATICHVKSRN